MSSACGVVLDGIIGMDLAVVSWRFGGGGSDSLLKYLGCIES